MAAAAARWRWGSSGGPARPDRPAASAGRMEAVRAGAVRAGAVERRGAGAPWQRGPQLLAASHTSRVPLAGRGR